MSSRGQDKMGRNLMVAAKSRSHMHRPVQSVTALLDSTFRAYRISTKMRKYAFFQRWDEIVGAALGKVTFPEKISRSGTLIVRVENTALSQELSLRKEEFLEVANRLADGVYINDIHFIVSDPITMKQKQQRAGSREEK